LTRCRRSRRLSSGRSTGGEIALELAHRFPDRVNALVLLEPAVFTVDPEAREWADRV
jgi:pimeloyl-ACP methyl ester carboxylesterase